MGIKFGREYSDIIDDLMVAMSRLDQVYDLLEMTNEDWNDLESEEQQECLKTLADDVFYGLGSEPALQVGHGSISYDKDSHIIKVNHGGNLIYVVYLI